MPETLLNRQLTLNFFQNQLGADTMQCIRKITFCGNDGDPIYCRDFIDICQWIKSVNPTIHLVVITNGSHKPSIWWQSLAEVLDHNDEINWSLDGWDQHSNNLYRINGDWSSIMQGIRTFVNHNHSTYRVWATIAFKFNQHNLDRMRSQAQGLGMDLWQLTKSTKFGSHYPATYGADDPLCPDYPDLVSSSHRFQRQLVRLNSRDRPSDDMKQIFWTRAQQLMQNGRYPALCGIGNKGVFLDSQGRFYPCCWIANRYDHNRVWHELAANRFDLHHRRFQELLTDPFWQKEFLQFDNIECQTKCTAQQMKNFEHVTEW